MRSEAADALKHAGRALRPVLSDLLPLLHDPDGAVRSRVVMLVAGIGDQSERVQEALGRQPKMASPSFAPRPSKRPVGSRSRKADLSSWLDVGSRIRIRGFASERSGRWTTDRILP